MHGPAALQKHTPSVYPGAAVPSRPRRRCRRRHSRSSIHFIRRLGLTLCVYPHLPESTYRIAPPPFSSSPCSKERFPCSCPWERGLKGRARPTRYARSGSACEDKHRVGVIHLCGGMNSHAILLNVFDRCRGLGGGGGADGVSPVFEMCVCIGQGKRDLVHSCGMKRRMGGKDVSVVGRNKSSKSFPIPSITQSPSLLGPTLGPTIQPIDTKYVCANPINRSNTAKKQ